MIFVRDKSCCFSGNREIAGDPDELFESVREKVEALIEKGYTDFYAGGAVGFDTLCERCVLALKNKYPHIRLILAVPFEGQERHWSISAQKAYSEVLKSADEVVILCKAPSKSAFFVRNRYMVDRSNTIIYYQRKSGGGTEATVEYAKKQGLELIPC